MCSAYQLMNVFLTDCLLHRTTFHLLPGQLKVNCLCCFCSMFCNVIITFLDFCTVIIQGEVFEALHYSWCCTYA